MIKHGAVLVVVNLRHSLFHCGNSLLCPPIPLFFRAATLSVFLNRCFQSLLIGPYKWARVYRRYMNGAGLVNFDIFTSKGPFRPELGDALLNLSRAAHHAARVKYRNHVSAWQLVRMHIIATVEVLQIHFVFLAIRGTHILQLVHGSAATGYLHTGVFRNLRLHVICM